MHSRRNHGCWRIGTHAAGVESCIAVAHALVILAGRHRQRRFAIHHHNETNFFAGKELFHLPDALLETMLLLCSSAAYGLAMVAMHKGDPRSVRLGLMAAFALGLGFLVMELAEFRHFLSIGAGPDRSGFLSAFFTLVGTHGLHVTFGLLWIVVMLAQLSSKGLTAPVKGRLTRLGMFWHFLDIVWIGVFTVVYLLGVVQ